MQFVIIAKDGTDNDALARRMEARPHHLSYSSEAIKRGEQITGGALLDENGKMIGSMMVLDFPSRKEFDEWLKVEPYMTMKVWQDIEVFPYRLGPSFQELKDKK